MKQQHTQGPWHVEQGNSIYAGNEYIGFALNGKPWGKELPYEANARLIAAAPELLEAAKTGASWMRWWLDQDSCECESAHTCGKTERLGELAIMEAAIAKATGEHKA